MILQVVTFPIKSDKKSAFESRLMHAVEASRKEDGVHLYLPSWSPEDANMLVLIEEYKSQEALDSHLEQEHTKAFLAELSDFLSGKAELRVYDVNGVDVKEIS
ncbi:MAG: putative quinol monooxygenase [Spirochaetota bacterium]